MCNVLSMIGRHVWNITRSMRGIVLDVGLASNVTGAGSGVCVDVVLRVRAVGRSCVILDVGNGCGIRNGALETCLTSWVGSLWVTVVPDVARILPNYLSVRDGSRHLSRTWSGDGKLG